MVRVLEPDTIVVYSSAPDDIFSTHKEAGINIVAFENYLKEVRKGLK